MARSSVDASAGRVDISKASQLVGKLSSDGTARLAEETSFPKTNIAPNSLKMALRAAAEAGSNSGSEEDYDTLKHDPDTIRGGRKGELTMDGVGGDTGLSSSLETSSRSSSGEKLFEAIKSTNLRPQPTRLKSIPVTLNKLQEEGRYVLTADDEALKKILKLGIERESNPGTAKKRRTKFSDLVFTRRFTAFDKRNTESSESPFHGFFTLFWLGTAIYMMKIAAENYRQHGNILATNEIMGLMFHRDVMVLALADGAMVAATGFGLILQRLIFAGYLSWNKQGWIIQTIWGALYLGAVIQWTLFREWPWTHTVFFVLHGLVMLMKQHSYAFYNGHLSEQYKMRDALLRRLKVLENISPADTASATSPRVSSMPMDYLESRPKSSEMAERRFQRRSSGDQGASNLAQVAAAIESGDALDLGQIQAFERIIKWEIDALTGDLKGKCSTGVNQYPNNLTLRNQCEYIVLPTLVYELEYPRSESINWTYVAEKSIGVLGILMIMNMVSQTYIYPVVIQCNEMKEAGLTLFERLERFPWILSDLIFPFMMEYMMTWYVIWECILNVLAEVTYFADRGFYADWWNSVSWDQYARDWNRPVHNFLLRHVYHSSISSMKVNKYTATLITFFLSALVHELVMWCLFKKLRGYLLILQMSQLPLVQLSRSKFLKGRATLGNIIFWIGLFTGPSLLCSLYLII